jgi:DNA-binding NarL/FixJ family response regulator
MKIMVTDDQPIIRDGLKYLLERMSDCEEVLLAENGFEAIDILKENKIDVIIMDLNMPKLNGIDAITEIRQFNDTVKILVLTSNTDKPLIKKAFLAGANGYLLKNTSPENLINAIQKISQNIEILDQNLDPHADDFIAPSRKSVVSI